MYAFRKLDLKNSLNDSYPQSELIKLLYTSLLRPHLEYAISSCCPFLEKDIKELEKVKRRATKLEPELRNLEYYDRLSKMNLKMTFIRED